MHALSLCTVIHVHRSGRLLLRFSANCWTHCAQEIADVLNWDLPESDYRALARLPQNLGDAKEKTTAGVLFEGNKA